MKSAVLHLGSGPPSPRDLAERLRQAAGGLPPPDGPPSFVLAFLPPAPDLSTTLAALAAAFPAALVFGCE
ncbi:MAG TPA: hypothetical protein VM599_03720, partial [Thermoanaerobaculia bacterium]|nr:hypothetical protein [Thermoanaerobaculia bacterium]